MYFFLPEFIFLCYYILMSKKLLILTAPFDALAGEYRYVSYNTPN